MQMSYLQTTDLEYLILNDLLVHKEIPGLYSLTPIVKGCFVSKDVRRYTVLIVS